MKPKIHPEYHECTISCVCGASYKTRSTRKSYKIDICAACHPHYTGESGQRLIDAAGRIEKFRRRYGNTTKS